MLQRVFTLEDMERFAGEAWGEIGVNVVNKWAELNESYFDGKLKPIPIIITPTLPFGKAIGVCSHDHVSRLCGHMDMGARLIKLNLPKDHDRLVADYNTLLHEMVHQFLVERGEYPKHSGEGWRREIMRLNKLITGKEIWAGRSKTVRKRDSEDHKSYVVRINEPHPDGYPSITQAMIARWPHDGCGIYLGRLGE
jgi:hypothetical protein